MLSPAAAIEYPYKVTHKGHFAFRSKDTQGNQVIYENGEEHAHAQNHLWCGTCEKAPTPLSIIAGDWQISREL